MKRVLFSLILVLLALPLLVTAQDDTDLPPLEDLGEGWNILVTGEETICARGTPYQFFVRPGDPEKLMVYFQGGGACWNALSCREDGGTFDDRVEDDEIDNYDGIFNFENEANPVADYSFVFVPYCTADIHTGSSQMSYARTEINHNGANNTAAVLGWVYANYEAPAELIVTGSSAGAYGAIYHAPYLLAQYPEADALVLGDAGIGVIPPDWQVLNDWNIFENLPDFVPGMESLDTSNFSNNVLYSSQAAAYPDAQFAQFTNALDEVQIGFFLFSGSGLTPEMWVEGMETSLDELDPIENYSSYVAPGGGHTILALPEFYELEVDGVALLDWFNALLDGETPASVRCEECDAAE